MRVGGYPEYRLVDVEWLTAIPEHWNIKPLKAVAQFINGEAFKPGDWCDEGVPIIRIQNLNGSREFNGFSGSVAEKYHVNANDLLFGWSGNRGTSFGPFVWKEQGLHYLNQHIFQVFPISAEKSWLYWSLKAVTFHVETQAHGIIGMVHVTQGELGNIRVPIPTLVEQSAIAAFLDRETDKIDALVAEQERLIALLKEKRQAVISHAVTKGLNPNAPMKDSGVEWLGEVPAHWSVRPLKRSIADGSSISYGIVQPGEPQTEGIPFIQTTNMTTGKFSCEDLQKTTSAIEVNYPRSRLIGGEVILGIRASIGAAYVVPPFLAGTNLSRGVARIEPKDDLTASYLAMFFKGTPAAEYWQASKQGSTFSEVSIETVRELPHPVPPHGEQLQIIIEMNHHGMKLDNLMVQATQAISLLRERRAALISAAVTGKIDVRTAIPDTQQAA